MRLLTFCTRDNPAPRSGLRQGKRIADLSTRGFPSRMKDLLAFCDQLRAIDFSSHATLDESHITYLPPIPDADKFLCVGKNYRTHLEELRRNALLAETPQEPTAFVKLNSCLVGHDAKVVKPHGITRLDYEPELVFVIGKRALGVKKGGDARSDALSYVAGVTILNDLTDRDSQQREVASGSRFWTGKNIPGFGPLGPEIVTMDEIRDPYDLWMTCSVNGEQRMRVNTADQIWKLPDILEHFSKYIPIEPGDMFSTGAPGGVAVGKPNAAALYLKPGDVVECSIEGIATLRTRIVAPRA
jgi:acylpyruvate hydrolase